jgi:hypothetical protein
MDRTPSKESTKPQGKGDVFEQQGGSSPSMYYRSWLAANMDKSTNKNKTQNYK